MPIPPPIPILAPLIFHDFFFFSGLKHLLDLGISGINFISFCELLDCIIELSLSLQSHSFSLIS